MNESINYTSISESTDAQNLQQKTVPDRLQEGLDSEHASKDKATTDHPPVQMEVSEKMKVTRKRSAKKDESSSEFGAAWKAQKRKYSKNGSSKITKEDRPKEDKTKSEKARKESTKKEKAKKEKIFVKKKREPDVSEYEVEVT